MIIVTIQSDCLEIMKTIILISNILKPITTIVTTIKKNYLWD